jgi:hypothetical protein
LVACQLPVEFAVDGGEFLVALPSLTLETSDLCFISGLLGGELIV